MKKIIILLISKGRNQLNFFLYLKYKNILIYDNLYITRKLIIKTNLKWLYIVIIKNSDIIYYLNNNFIDFIFLGQDIILENKINKFYKIYNLYFINFKLSLISNNNLIKLLSKKNSLLTVSTKYINISKNYFNFKNLKFNFIKINSASELSLIFKSSDLIIDIISSGQTVSENNLYRLIDLVKFNNNLLLNFKLFYDKLLNYFLVKLFFCFYAVLYK